MSNEPDGKLRIVRLEPNDGETTTAEQIPEGDLTEIESYQLGLRMAQLIKALCRVSYQGC